MDAATNECVEKAEADYQSAVHELRRRKSPNLDLACFCAQQCAEKYLRAVLQKLDRAIPRTHNLPYLIVLLKDEFAELELLKPRAKFLTNHSVAFRYPGSSASSLVAREALSDATLFREKRTTTVGLVHERHAQEATPIVEGQVRSDR